MRVLAQDSSQVTTTRSRQLKTKSSSTDIFVFEPDFFSLALNFRWFHCPRKTRIVRLQDNQIEASVQHDLRKEISLQMANIKLEHDLDWIVDRLVSQPGHLHLQFKQRARTKFSDSDKWQQIGSDLLTCKDGENDGFSRSMINGQF